MVFVEVIFKREDKISFKIHKGLTRIFAKHLGEYIYNLKYTF